MDVKRKRKKRTGNRGEMGLPSNASIARAAGVSRQLVWRKRKQGKTPGQIVREANRRREFEARRNTDEPFLAAQRRRVTAVASKHELELAHMRARLIPVGPIMNWFGQVVSEAPGIFDEHLSEDLMVTLATTSDPRTCVELLDAAARGVLTSLGNRAKELAEQIGFSETEREASV